MKLLIPPTPRKGDTIRIISPSAGIFPFVPERVQRATAALESVGFRVKIATYANKNVGYVSGTIDERVSDIHESFNDVSCSIIMAAIGGNHANQLIGKLDYGLIRKNPKVFVGYSDNTVLHCAMATQANLQTYYGPCLINQFGEYPKPFQYTLKCFLSAVLKQSPKMLIEASDVYTDEVLDWFKKDDMTRPRNMQKAPGFIWWREGESSGWAYPFTVPSINHILGTKYVPDPTGSILMIDIPEGHSMYEGLSDADFDAYMTDLELAGMFAECRGIIVSIPYKYTKEMLASIKEIILRLTTRVQCPVLSNVNFGHTDPVITIPIGARIELSSNIPDSFMIVNS